MTAPSLDLTRGGVRKPLVGPRFLSVCSGIEAASVALEPLGFVPAGFAEIDKAASALLARRFPHVRNFGDFTALDPREVGPVDWLIGGTPCQAFSIAGKRLSLADARGNLTLAYAVLAHELARHNGLRGALWENVPGVLSMPDNAFGCFLAALVGSERALIQPRGTGWPDTGMVDGPWARAAWIVRDAQYFGLAQRRERVFVVVGFGDRIDPAAILFERAGLSGNPAPRRETRETVAPTLAARTRGGGGLGTDFDCDGGLIASTLEASMGRRCGQAQLAENLIPAWSLDLANLGDGGNIGYREASEATHTLDTSANIGVAIACDIADTLTVGANQTSGYIGDFVAHSLRGEGFDDASEDGTGRGTPIGPVAFAQNSRDEVRFQGGGDIAGALAAEPGMKQSTYVALEEPYTLAIRGRGDDTNLEYRQDGTANALLLPNGGRAGIGVGAIATRWAVRRLTPRECERLQGFPDGWTDGQADGPRYRQLGNSMAVPVIRWIGERILAEEAA